MTQNDEAAMREKAREAVPLEDLCGCFYEAGVGQFTCDKHEAIAQALLDVAMEKDESANSRAVAREAKWREALAQARAELELAKNEQTPCPHIIVGEDGTHYCSLAEANVTQQAQVNDVTIAQLRAELAKVSTALGQSAVAEASLRADLERAQGTIKRYNEAFLHRHVAHYKTVGDQDILTDTCEECGLDLRDDIHKRVQALAKKE